jgi:hypothetical protein
MKSPREQKREEAAAWIDAGFKSYADRLGKDEVPSRTEIEQYGGEFSRVVRCEAGDLGQDLHALMKHGCPAVAIVQLIVLCTNGFHLTITDVLRGAGITDEVLRDVKQSLPRTVQVINVLNDPTLPGPLDCLVEMFPKKLDQRRARRSIEALPEALRILAEMLKEYTDPMIETIAENEFPLSLYLLLRRHGGFGFPTLSRLLKTMRLVRHTVSPNEKYLHNFESAEITSGKRKGKKTDPFSKESLEQRLHRFKKYLPGATLQAHNRVNWYLSDAYANQRKSGKTLLESIVEGLKEERTNSPEGCADSLSKVLTLSDEQKAEVLAILADEGVQIARAFISMSSSPRRTATSIFPAVFSHKEVLPKLREIGMRRAEMIRRVLNPEQQVTFDRMEQKAERELERMESKASRSRKL